MGLTETSVICYGKACGFRHTSLATEEKHPDGTKRIQQTYAQSEPTNRVPSDQQSRDAGNIINGYGDNMTEMDAAKTLTEKLTEKHDGTKHRHYLALSQHRH